MVETELRKLKIAILGTRGIPNNYGGFEECAAQLSVDLVKRGHDVIVYNPDTHPFEGSEWNGVKIEKIFFKENIFRFLSVFIFDYLSLKDAVKKKYDIILELGYSPASLFFGLVRRGSSKIITNMDGLEWKRDKWGCFTKKLLKFCERMAVKRSDALISDNIGIQEYLLGEYNVHTEFIPYGADIPVKPDEAALDSMGLKIKDYFLLIARLEPENNIELILDGYLKSGSDLPFIVIGPLDTKYTKSLLKKYKNEVRIRFLDGIYEKDFLVSLRYFCTLYFHGHSVGGTNPSLLEAMSDGAPLVAHNNIFNRGVLGTDAYYFSSPDEVATLISGFNADRFIRFSKNNIEKIKGIYNWQKISDGYQKVFIKITGNEK